MKTNKHLFLLRVATYFLLVSKHIMKECYALSKYPMPDKLDLLKQKKSVLKLKRLIKQNSLNWLKLKATYQSDVTSLPISLPNVTVNPPNKDQYRATVDVGN
jgi:hypothetical protein